MQRKCEGCERRRRKIKSTLKKLGRKARDLLRVPKKKVN